MPSKDDVWKKEAERIRNALREEGTPTTPTPTVLKTEKDWVQFDGTNMLNFKPEGHSKEDVPPLDAFKNTGKKYYMKVRSYLLFKIRSVSTKKRTLDIEEENEAKKQCGKRDLEASLFSSPEDREAAMRAAVWDDMAKKVIGKAKDFRDRGGCQGF